jgi:carboxynorspermidine decarboxylase
VYLEPGEAIALNTGLLIAEVVDVLDRDKPIAILDTSVTAHMPDVLEMPYRPGIIGGGNPGEKAYTYTLGGLTCLAGDVIGEWSFDQPLKVGSRLAFTDMAHYTMVKTTTFNGVKLPSIATYDPGTDSVKVLRTFGYADYRNRLS